jgi:hypothetical protein
MGATALVSVSGCPGYGSPAAPPPGAADAGGAGSGSGSGIGEPDAGEPDVGEVADAGAAGGGGSGEAGKSAPPQAGHAAGAGGTQVEAGAGGAGAGGTSAVETPRTTHAVHTVVQVSWSSRAVKSGTGNVHIWTRTKLADTGKDASFEMEASPCGSILPVITTIPLAGGKMILAEIPDAAWDMPSMPRFKHQGTRSGKTLSFDAGVALVGLSMTDPEAAWPETAKEITPVDHDGDGNPGVTAIPRNDDGYAAPPTSLAQSQHVDKMYLAIRNAITMSLTAADDDPDTYTGTANVTMFDSHVVGCHIQGGGNCATSDRDFIDQNNVTFNVKSASVKLVRVDDDATCADVRATLPIE